MKIEFATLNDVAQLNELYFKCSENMKQKYGLNHWDSAYQQEILTNRINSKQVHVVKNDGQIIASFMLVKEYPQPYIDAIGIDDIPFTYLNRLAVTPELQGQGTGKWCMKQLEEISISSGSKVLRLDILDNYKQLMHFYESIGYKQIGKGKTRRFQILFYQKYL